MLLYLLHRNELYCILYLYEGNDHFFNLLFKLHEFSSLDFLLVILIF